MKRKGKKQWIACITIIAVLIATLSSTITAFAAFDVSGAQEIKEGGLGLRDWSEYHDGQHSSWEEPASTASGFIVPADYANKLKKASGFTTSSFGSTVSWASIEPLYASQPRNDDGFYFFDTAQITKGCAGVWLKNIAIYDNAVGADVKLDCKITIMDWEVVGTDRRHVFIEKSEIPGIDIGGLDEAKLKWEYFKAGTTTPYQLKSNVTFDDIDSTQYMAFRADQVLYQFASKDSNLRFKADNGYNMYHNPVPGNDPSRDPKNAFGAAYNTNTVTYSYGTKNNGSYSHFGELAYSMFKPTPNDPTKSISSVDGKPGGQLTLTNRDEPMLFNVQQVVANGYAPATFFKNFKMEDTLEDCLEILDAEVRQNGVATSLFDVDITGQTVTATASTSALNTEDFYDKTYNLVIKAKIKDDITDEELAAYMSGDMISIPNTGTVTIDDEPRDTEEVTAQSWEPKPEKKISDLDEIDVTSNTMPSRLEQFTYKVAQDVPAELTELSKLEFTDQVESCLEVKEVRVLADGADDTGQWSISTADNNVVATANNPGEDQAGIAYALEITVQLKFVSDSVLQDHGHFSADRSTLNFKNKAALNYTIGEGEEQSVDTGEVDTTVRLPVDIKITKDVNRYEHQVGDPIYYTVKFSHNTASCDASDVVVRDTDLSNFDLDIAGATVSGITDYTLKPVSGGWEFNANKLSPGQEVTIKFTAKAKKVLNGTIPKNTVTLKAFGVPEKSDSEEVYINSPKMKLTKETERVGYKVGDTIDYVLEITQINKGTFMRDVIFTDEIKTPGVNLMPGTIIVLDKNGKDVTSTMDVTIKNNTFTVKTKRNFGDSTEKIPPKDRGISPYKEVELTSYLKICYSAKAATDSLSGQDVVNVAELPTRPNTNNEDIKNDPDIPSGGTEIENKVPIAGAELKISKDSDKNQYEVGDIGEYTVKVEQIREDYKARNVVIEDQFQIEGMKIDKDSIVVKKERKDITKDCAITTTDTGYRIKTNEDLAYNEYMTVTYKVLFETRGLQDKAIENVAVTRADNAKQKEIDHVVGIGDWQADLKLTKESDKTQYEVGDTVHYKLQVSNENDNSAQNVIIKDQLLKSGIDIDTGSIRVLYNARGAVSDITKACKIAAYPDYFEIRTNRGLPKGNTITVTYNAVIKDKKLAGQNIDNIAITSADNAEDEKVEHQIEVLPLAVLDIVKSSDKTLYTILDDIKYHLKVTNIGGTTAKNVIISDNIKTDGMKLQEGSIVVRQEGTDITKDCVIKVSGNAFTILTGKNLVVGCSMEVTYTADIADRKLAGQNVDNITFTTADNSDGDQDFHKVPIEALAVLDLVKTTDKELYTILDDVKYSLKVTNTSDPIALNVVIKDRIKTEGLNLLPDTIKVVDPDGVDITKDCKITTEGNAFTIETGRNLGKNRSMEVTYTADIADRTLAGKEIENAAFTTADNSDPVEEEKVVPVEPLAVLDLEKSTDKKIYTILDDVKYTLKVTNNSEPTAINVVISDSIKTKDLQLIQDTIRIKDTEGTDITKDCKVTALDNDFTIETGKNLEKGQFFTVTYTAKMMKRDLAGKDLENVAVVESDNSDPEEEEKVVPVEPLAQLQIKKTSEEKKYKVGDLIKYQLEVKNVSKVTAINVVIRDEIKTAGVVLQKDSIQVKYGFRNITKGCDITAKQNRFFIKTNRNLPAAKTMIVTYSAKISDKNLAGKQIENIAITKGDNTPTDGDDNSLFTRLQTSTGIVEVTLPPGAGSGSGSGSLVQTGDTFQLWWVLGTMVLSGLAVLILVLRRKKEGKPEDKLK